MIDIRRASYEESKKLKEFDEFIGDRRINNLRGEMFVALIEDNLVGFIVYSSNYFYDRPMITTVNVRKEFRRSGIAQKLFQKVINIFEGIDLWTSTEDNKEEAMNLFRKLEFEEQGRISKLNKGNIKEVCFLKEGNLK